MAVRARDRGDCNTTVLAERANFLGRCGVTNNIAGFTALLDGFGLAREFIMQEHKDSVAGLLVMVHGDSELAMNVMTDRAEFHNPKLKVSRAGRGNRERARGT
jgi:hypothetical protein